MATDKTKVSVSCKLLDLPCEIRVRIYRCYVQGGGSNEPVRVSCCFPPKMSLESFEPALSRTSQQVRDEVLPIFYANRSFEMFIVQWHLPCVLITWKKMLKDEYAMAIQRLVFRLSNDDGWRNARQFLEIMEKNFSPTCVYLFVGESSRMCEAFQRSCEVGKTLRVTGMDWDAVEENLDKVAQILYLGGFDNVWEVSDDDFDEDVDDSYSDDEEEEDVEKDESE